MATHFSILAWKIPWTVTCLGGSVVKNLTTNTGDTGDVGSILGSGRSPGGVNSNPLQYS